MNVDYIVSHVRYQFEHRSISRSLLMKLYSEYTPIKNVDAFVKQAYILFPKLNCGLTAVYLRFLLKKGNIVRGRYGKHFHTFLLLDQKTVVDITADQYGGPRIYVGNLLPPWKLK